MNFKAFIDKIVFYISVPKCASCGERLSISEDTLCKSCFMEYNDAKYTDCSICAKLTSECSCSTKHLRNHYIKKIIKVYRYKPGTEPPTNQLLYRLKRDNRSDVRHFLANELIKSIENKGLNLDNFIITNIPRRRASIKRYGFDHTCELAKLLSMHFNIKYIPLLVSRSKKDQKQNKSREERMLNANYAYKRNVPDIKGKSVLLLDDIITTGASMGSAAMLIHGLGAKEIIALSIAIAYKDDYTPFAFTYN